MTYLRKPEWLRQKIYSELNYNHVKDKARNKYAYLLKALENDYASAIGQIRLGYYIEKE